MIPEDTQPEAEDQVVDDVSVPPGPVTVKPWNLTMGMYCRAGRGGTMFTRR